MEVLTINGQDYSRYIEQKGFGWSRKDRDNNITTKNGSVRRNKLATKRELSYQLSGMPRSALAALDDALSASTFRATYLDLHGEQSREFYCSSFSATLEDVHGDTDIWGDAAFSMTEV